MKKTEENKAQDEQDFKNHYPSESLKVQNLCHDQVKNVIHVAPAGDKGMRHRSFGWSTKTVPLVENN